jgi:hypothetical protein
MCAWRLCHHRPPRARAQSGQPFLLSPCHFQPRPTCPCLRSCPRWVPPLVTSLGNSNTATGPRAQQSWLPAAMACQLLLRCCCCMRACAAAAAATLLQRCARAAGPDASPRNRLFSHWPPQPAAATSIGHSPNKMARFCCRFWRGPSAQALHGCLIAAWRLPPMGGLRDASPAPPRVSDDISPRQPGRAATTWPQNTRRSRWGRRGSWRAASPPSSRTMRCTHHERPGASWA